MNLKTLFLATSAFLCSGSMAFADCPELSGIYSCQTGNLMYINQFTNEDGSTVFLLKGGLLGDGKVEYIVDEQNREIEFEGFKYTSSNSCSADGITFTTSFSSNSVQTKMNFQRGEEDSIIISIEFMATKELSWGPGGEHTCTSFPANLSVKSLSQSWGTF